MNKKFKVECEMDGDVLNLSTTLNGYQWCTIRIYDPENEVPQIIEALQPFNKGNANVCACEVPVSKIIGRKRSNQCAICGKQRPAQR